MRNKIQLASNTIDKKDLNELIKWLNKEPILTKNSLTIKFEKLLSNYFGVKYSIFVNSGSSANLLSINSLLINNRLRNKTVIVPSLSWSTTISPLMQNNFKIIPCDIDMKSLGMNLKDFNNIIKKYKPSLCIVVNVLGHDGNINQIRNICKRENIVLFEDSCESMGSLINKTKHGTFGKLSSFSLYYGHQISTIEGGIILTNSKQEYETIISLRSHGWMRDNSLEFKRRIKSKEKISEFRENFSFIFPGYNLRSTDLNAFIGIQQLKKLKKMNAKRHKIFEYYKKKLDKYWYQSSQTTNIASMGYVTFVRDRDKLYTELKKNNIESRPVISGSLTNQIFFKKYDNKINLKCKNAETVDRYGLYLPVHPYLSIKEVDKIIKIVKKYKPFNIIN